MCHQHPDACEQRWRPKVYGGGQPPYKFGEGDEHGAYTHARPGADSPRMVLRRIWRWWQIRVRNRIAILRSHVRLARAARIARRRAIARASGVVLPEDRREVERLSADRGNVIGMLAVMDDMIYGDHGIAREMARADEVPAPHLNADQHRLMKIVALRETYIVLLVAIDNRLAELIGRESVDRMPQPAIGQQFR